MLAIWKFPLSGRLTTVSMPKGAKVLCVQLQGTVTTLWAQVPLPDDDTPPVMERRSFLSVHTGDEVTDTFGVYIGTVLTSSGSHVDHIFEPPAE